MGVLGATLNDVVMEMAWLEKYLPPRPTSEELEAAVAQINRADVFLACRLEESWKQQLPDGVLPPVFGALQEMRRDFLEEQAREQKRLAQAVIDLEERHRRCDGLIQRAHSALIKAPNILHRNSQTSGTKDRARFSLGPPRVESLGSERTETQGTEGQIERSKSCAATSVNQISTIRVALQSEPQNLAKPASIETANSPSTLDGSLSSGRGTFASMQNRKVVPSRDGEATTSNSDVHDPSKVISMLDMAAKKELKKLDLHGIFLNELRQVPESIGRLTWVTDLNLSGNRLTSLPESIGGLVNITFLDVSANRFTSLPESLGCLVSLKILNIEKNKIEELPWNIGHCRALEDINADFNQLKALPEAVGHLKHLHRLSLHLNCLRSLPTTISLMTSLTELDVHFNQLEYIPESLCFVTALTRLNIASNFTDLKELPQSIGRLQKLKELDFSYNHVTVLPNSFTMLKNLQVLRCEGNPLRVPPWHVANQGIEAVIKYMVEYIAHQEDEQKRLKKRGMWRRFVLSFMKGKSKQLDGDAYLKAIM